MALSVIWLITSKVFIGTNRFINEFFFQLLVATFGNLSLLLLVGGIIPLDLYVVIGFFHILNNSIIF